LLNLNTEPYKNRPKNRGGKGVKMKEMKAVYISPTM